jgi:hypothetical protein
MFASKGVWLHLLRGVIGFGALVAAFSRLESQPAVALGLFVVGVIALRGCPTCWLFGLFETIAARARGDEPRGGCVDGSCARPAVRDP